MVNPGSHAVTAAADAGRAPRADGEASRERLLQAGLRLFAQQGFSKTSTRELAEAAAVNIASISYYFGDKAGLYRAVFLEPMGTPPDDLQRLNDPGLSLPELLQTFYAGFLEPLKQGDVARQCMKLHFREMLEPTGLWDEAVAHGIRPLHDALLLHLVRHFGLKKPDADLQRLTVCLAGLGVHMHVGRDVIDQVAPGLTQGAQDFDLWAQRLVMFGLAMVDAEMQRRAGMRKSPK
jgi:TetR/AcrR family transcriptional regulator, regulator of cefoperazone and chloramphenicol sensitivity